MSSCCDNCGRSVTAIERCGCCDGTTISVPRSLAQRPWLSALDYRIGTHSMFLETMLAGIATETVVLPASDITSWLFTSDDIIDHERLISRLETAVDLPGAHLWSQFASAEQTLLTDAATDEAAAVHVLVERLNSIVRGASIHTAERFANVMIGWEATDLLAAEGLTADRLQQLNRLLIEAALRGRHVRRRQATRPLAGLTTRESNDFSIALLDGWATVSDVVTFYQERIANEGFLRTATERRSILELGRLTGYEPRPGVAASVHLAFTLQDGHRVEIPAGTRAQSTPDPEELPQPFETSDPLIARSEWNQLRPRMTRPQAITSQNADIIERVYFAGTTTALKKNDVLLFDFGTAEPVLRTVVAVEEDDDAGRTLARLSGGAQAVVEPGFLEQLRGVVNMHLALDEFNVGPSQTAERVVGHLELLGELIDTGDISTVLKGLAEVLPALEREHEIAVEAGNARLGPWLESLVDALHGVLESRTGSGTGSGVPPSSSAGNLVVTALDAFRRLELGGALAKPRSLQPANSLRLDRGVAATFAPSADTLPRLLTKLQPAYERGLYAALAGATVQPAPAVQIYVFRVQTSLYGHNAPERPLVIDPEDGTVTSAGDPGFDERLDVVDLTQPFDEILAGSWVVIDRPDIAVIESEISVASLAPAVTTAGGSSHRIFARAATVRSAARADYGISGKVTRLRLAHPMEPDQPVEWFDPERESYELIRGTTVLAQAEPLTLAEAPLLASTAAGADDLETVRGNRLELAQVYDGLEPGRWIIVSGERADIAGVDGVAATELAMLAAVEQTADIRNPGEALHTVLTLAGTGSSGSAGLSYEYRRDTVRIYGNVVKATHGETVEQVLGSGDGGAVLQTFALSRPPLTHVSAPTPAGAAAELDVRVNGVRWSNSPSLVELGPTARAYITRTDNDAVTSVTFGDGTHGARLPSGGENVAAKYRTGIGLAGNVAERRIDMLMERPLGVKEVINPIEASGGADREGRDSARANTPLAVMSLDRLVSVQDYTDFAQTFAGVTKADAQLLAVGRRRVVHLTVALDGDGALDRNGDFYSNLRRALIDFGDPDLAVTIDHRQVRLIVVSARVRIGSAYLWELVEPAIRARLTDVLGFDRRHLGRGSASSEVLSAIHAIEGVEYVDLDVFDWVDEQRILTPDDPQANGSSTSTGGLGAALGLRAVVPARLAHLDADRRVVPAQLVYLNAEVRETLILEELL